MAEEKEEEKKEEIKGIQRCPVDSQGRYHGYSEILMPDGTRRCRLFLHGLKTVEAFLYPSGSPMFISATDWRIGHEITIDFQDNWIPQSVRNCRLSGEMNGIMLFPPEGPQFTFDKQGKPDLRIDVIPGAEDSVNVSSFSEDALHASWKLFKHNAAWAMTCIKWQNDAQKNNIFTRWVSDQDVPYSIKGPSKFSLQKPKGKGRNNLRKVLKKHASSQKATNRGAQKPAQNQARAHGFDHRAHRAER